MQLQILGYVALAMALGAVIGLDRELADKPAGLRTHMLVAGASALFVSLGEIALFHFVGRFSDDFVRTDPVRLIESIITGVSVLGAGTILYHRPDQQVEGLTTAASILFTTAMGVAVAFRQITLAVGVTALAFVTLRILGYIELQLKQNDA